MGKRAVNFYKLADVDCGVVMDQWSPEWQECPACGACALPGGGIIHQARIYPIN